MKIERVVFRNGILPANVEVFPQVRLCYGGTEWPGAGQRSNDRRTERVIALRKHRHRELVMYQRPTDVRLEVLPLVRKFYGSIELRSVESVVSKIEVKVTAYFSRTGFRDDLDTSE